MEKKWPPHLDHLNDFDNKVGTLIERKKGWWGNILVWDVDGKTVTTNTNSSFEFKDAELGAKARIYFHTMGNFWVARKLD
jgi:hypothetical protein